MTYHFKAIHVHFSEPVDRRTAKHHAHHLAAPVRFGFWRI